VFELSKCERPDVRSRVVSHLLNIDVALATRDGGVWAQVRDDGKGLAPDATEESPPGHLGLSAMRERAEMAGGWLRVEGKPGSGTTVEFWLPVGSDEGVEA